MIMSWDPDRIRMAGDRFASLAETTQKVAVSLPMLRPEAYGSLVGTAASMTEPATREANRHFLFALSTVLQEVSWRLRDTSRRYEEVESEALDAIEDLLNQLETDPSEP